MGARQGNPQFGDVFGADGHAVKTISDVDFAEFGWAVLRVAVNEARQDPLECAAKLHRLAWGKSYRVVVDLGERIVDNEPGPTVPLRDHA